MAEPTVTVVRCRACRESGSLTLTDGRFWCGWCQRWAELDTERVVGAAVVREGDDFRLAPARPTQIDLQPLRVPNGWRIIWTTLYEEEPTEPANANGYYFGGTDLFLATHEARRRTIDIEWRTEPDQPTVGRYLLRVYPLRESTPEDRHQYRTSEPFITDWDSPLHIFETTVRLALVAELEACLRGERG
jgi:hypothetical protein